MNFLIIEITVSNQSNDSQGFYSVYTDRETSPGAVDKGARVAVLRTIPGDDGGEVEELVLLISSEFIREQDLKEITRVKWFLPSIEEWWCDQVPVCVGG